MRGLLRSLIFYKDLPKNATYFWVAFFIIFVAIQDKRCYYKVYYGLLYREVNCYGNKQSIMQGGFQ